MSTTGTVGDGYAAARGVAALVVMLGVARLPDRLAGAGATLAARIAPPEADAEHGEHGEHAVHLPAQRSRSTSGPTARPITV